jgi:hypothetical protein
MPESIYELLRSMVQDCGKPAKRIAQEVGKPYSTLMRELNATDRGAKLDVDLLLPLMRACESVQPLRFLAARMGCRVSSLARVKSEKASLHEGLLDTYPALAEYHQAIREGRPLEQVAELREQVIRQVQEDFVAFAQEPGAGSRAGD